MSITVSEIAIDITWWTVIAVIAGFVLLIAILAIIRKGGPNAPGMLETAVSPFRWLISRFGNAQPPNDDDNTDDEGSES